MDFKSISARIDDLEEEFLFSNLISPSLAALKKELSDSAERTHLFDTGDTAYTTIGNEFIPCINTAAGDITLNTAPLDRELVTIKVRDANVTVVGLIDGTSDRILTLNDAITVQYSSDLSGWLIV